MAQAQAQLLLAAPSNPSTFLQEVIPITGLLSGVSNPDGKFTLLIDSQETLLSEPEVSKRNDEFIVKFKPNLSELIPSTSAERKYHLVQLKYLSEGIEVISPASHIQILERSSWSEPSGNYVYPDINPIEIASRYLVIEGWAIKSGCTQGEVNIHIDGKKFKCPNINVWSPVVGQANPSIEQALRSHFNVVIKRSELYLPFWPHHRYYAEIKFSDGSIFKLPKMKLEWRKPPKKSIRQANHNKGILFVANNLRSTEGAPRVLFELIKLSKSLGLRIGVISPVGGEHETYLRELGVELFIVPELYLAHYSRIENFNQQTKATKELIEDFSPNIVFGNTIESFWAISHAQSLGIRTLWLIHESINPKTVFEELDPRARLLFLSALDNNDLIFVSEATKRLFKTSKAKAQVIPNGVRTLELSNEQRSKFRAEVRAKFKVPDNCPLILNVGTICKRKGQDFLISALAELKDLEFRAILVGGRAGEFLENLKSQIHRLGLNEKVFIEDETPAVEKYYAGADIFVISSREESAPLVSLEALNWSLPIVSTDAFGLVEQLKNSKAALLSPVDDLKLYVSGLRKMILDKDFRMTSATAGKLWVNKQFNLTTTLETYKDLLERNY